MILSPNEKSKSLIVNTNISVLIDVKAWTTSLFDEYIENKNLLCNLALDYQCHLKVSKF